jgi:hypothetical protein
MQSLRIGDAIEFDQGDERVTALVLLANGDAAIIDFCDGSTPVSVVLDELPGLAVYSGDADASFARSA